MGALVLYVPWVALSIIPGIDYGPSREFNGNYYGVFRALLRPFPLAWLFALCAAWPASSDLRALFGLAGLVALNNYEFGSGLSWR